MRLLRSAEHRVMPWKNGLGQTTEIAVHPPRATVESFDWRISMASVASDGPFSAFPGIDRTLAVLGGQGLDLTIAGKPTRLHSGSLPLSFPADVEISAKLLAGPITDLNVMTRRGRYAHEVMPLQAEGTVTLNLAGDTVVIVCQSGSVEVSGKDQVETMQALDAIVTSNGRFEFRTLPNAALFIVSIDPAG